MYNFLKDFQYKDLQSPHFRTELYLKIKELLIESFNAEETFYTDNEVNQKVECLASLFLDIYKMGLAVGNGKTFKHYADDYTQHVLNMSKIFQCSKEGSSKLENINQ